MISRLKLWMLLLAFASSVGCASCTDGPCVPDDCAGTCQPDGTCLEGDGGPAGDGDGDVDAGEPEDGEIGAPCEGASDCDSLACFGGRCAECDGPSDCDLGETCVDGSCASIGECTAEELCGSGGSCCPDDGDCVGAVCRAPCETQRCGPDLAQCCGGDQVCYGGGCVDLGPECQLQADCDEDEVCELDLGVCLPAEAVGTCEYIPPPGVFQPEIECRWTAAGLEVTPTRGDIVMAPVVGNLTDDNGDGVTSRLDIPDVVFATYDLDNDGCCNRPATLRVVSGACAEGGGMTTHASITDPAIDNSGGLALGDLDGDGVMEIVAITIENNQTQGTAAFRRTADDGSSWELLWHNPTYPTWDVHTRGGTQPSLTDLEGDGTVEVIVGNVVLEGLDGSLRWDGVVTSAGVGGIGNNAFLGPVSIAADLDLDGVQEVIAGNTVYAAADGEVQWSYAYTTEGSPCGGNLPCDGYPAAANFDDDPEGEVAVVRQGEVFIFEHDGGLKRRIPIPVDDCANNESGPPTVADFDGDGRAEVGTAAGDFYVVVDLDCAEPDVDGCLMDGVLWAVPNEDCTSRVTASSVFDFEGDGAAEVVYADEDTFRILAGIDGEELYVDATHGSHTRLEMAVIADVDNDGNAEVVIAENGWGGGTAGVEIWGDALDNWVFTRRIWNQHSYHVSNVTEDGTVQGGGVRNWSSPALNNFRQNVQGEGIFWAPDLTVDALSALCTAEGEASVAVTVSNQGSRMVGPGLEVAVFLGAPSGDPQLLGMLETTVELFPGQSETLSASYPVEGQSFVITVRVDDDGTGGGAHNECDEMNNEAFQGADCFLIGG